jgi:hypothetical protein
MTGLPCYEVNDYESLVFMENAGVAQYDTARELNGPLLRRTSIAGPVYLSKIRRQSYE